MNGPKLNHSLMRVTLVFSGQFAPLAHRVWQPAKWPVIAHCFHLHLYNKVRWKCKGATEKIKISPHLYVCRNNKTQSNLSSLYSSKMTAAYIYYSLWSNNGLSCRVGTFISWSGSSSGLFWPFSTYNCLIIIAHLILFAILCCSFSPLSISLFHLNGDYDWSML